MAPFERRFSDEQRDAIVAAYEDRRIRPARRVAELAAAGELELHGRRLDPFRVSEDTIRDMARKARRARSGLGTSHLAEIPHRDAVEQLRRRLVAAADLMLTAVERAVKRDPASADPERLRQITRAVREAAALPGPDSPRPRAPGEHGRSRKLRTRDGLAGAILADMRGDRTQPAPQHNAHDDSTSTREHSSGANGNVDDTRQNLAHEPQAGSRMRELLARVSGDLGGE